MNIEILLFLVLEYSCEKREKSWTYIFKLYKRAEYIYLNIYIHKGTESRDFANWGKGKVFRDFSLRDGILSTDTWKEKKDNSTSDIVLGLIHSLQEVSHQNKWTDGSPCANGITRKAVVTSLCPPPSKTTFDPCPKYVRQYFLSLAFILSPPFLLHVFLLFHFQISF